MTGPEKEQRQLPQLANLPVDFVTTALRAGLGSVPVAGAVLAEIVGTIIPNQRTDRLCKFITELDDALGKIERDLIRSKLTDENFTDLVEESIRQAARSTSDDRRKYIANLVANSLMPGHTDLVESKHLLRLLGEINDAEVLWLRYRRMWPNSEEDHKFRERHHAVFSGPRWNTPEWTKYDTFKRAYQEHLCQLDLLSRSYEMDATGRKPEFHEHTGVPQVKGYSITHLGELLLKHVGLTPLDAPTMRD